MMEGGVGGETVELVVDGEDVYLPHEDGTVSHLDNLTASPSVLSTWPVTVSKNLIYKVTGKKTEVAEEESFVLPAEEEKAAVKAPRRSRAAELREQRIKGSRDSTPGSSAAATPALSETETGDDESEEVDSAAPEAEAGRQRKKGPGKANAARRRKLANKK